MLLPADQDLSAYDLPDHLTYYNHYLFPKLVKHYDNKSFFPKGVIKSVRNVEIRQDIT